MANSPLFRQRGDVATVREAVFALELWRTRDLAFSCNMPLLFANLNSAVLKEAFWRHTLATALVAQKLGSDFGNTTSEQTYLAGLLHDIGILINALLLPQEFQAVTKEAVHEHSSVAPLEQRIMGFTHAESGRIVAGYWELPVEVSGVIEFHYCVEKQKSSNELTVIVQVANQLCWNSGMGYGYPLPEYAVMSPEETWRILSKKFPKAHHSTCEDYSPVLESNLTAARELADHAFGAIPVCT